MLLQQKEMIMTYPVKNRLGYDKIGLMYNSCSRLLDPESDRTGAVQLATVNGEGGVSLTNLLYAPELPKGDSLKRVIRKILLMYVFSSVEELLGKMET